MNNLKAVIDIGSNSCLFLAGHFDGRKFFEKESISTITGLGRDLDLNNEFIPEAMEDTFEALSNYKNRASALGLKPGQIKVTATEASRVANNAQTFFEKIKKELGFEISIISSSDEAYYSALGASLGFTEPQNELILMDIGGASTEFIKITRQPFKVIESISLPMGVVRATAWIEKGLWEQEIQRILNLFSQGQNYKTKMLVGIAGSITTHAAMLLELPDYDDKAVHGQRITVKNYKSFSEKIFKLSADELLEKYPYIGKRAKVSHAGCYIINTITEALNTEEIYVSTFGLRHGVLFES